MRYARPYFFAGLILLLLTAAAGAQTWDEWHRDYFEGERDEVLGPPEYRLIRERYAKTIEDLLDPIIREYAETLPQKEEQDFLQGKLLLQVNSGGRAEMVDLLGNYTRKHQYRKFMDRVKTLKYPKFPDNMRDGLIEIKYTLDPNQKRNRVYVRYFNPYSPYYRGPSPYYRPPAP
jgi:hypothetical protein